MPNRLKALGILTGVVLAFGVVLRVLYLDADPRYYDWIGYLTDEGRWVYQARDYFLFHTFSRDAVYDLHLILAPLFQLVNHFVFDLIGISSLSSRLFTALCGSALLLLFWTYLRHAVTPQALLLGVMLLAVQVDFVVLSRIAVPEMVVIFLQALVYFALVAREPSRRRMAMLGVVMLIATGMKGTVVLSLGIFLLLLLFMPRTPGESAGGPGRWRSVLWFSGGFAAPVLISGAVWVGCCVSALPFGVGEISGSGHLSRLVGFLKFSDAYRILSFPFRDSLAPVLNYLALGLWLSWLGWIAADRDEVDTLTRRYLVTSMIWTGAYFVMMLALDYFPRRYMVHIVLPMVINLTVGISLLQKVGFAKVRVALQRKDRAQLPRLAVFVLPTAALLAPLLASAIALGGIDPEPLRIQLACVALAVALTTCLARQVASRARALDFFVVFPVVQASLWAVLSVAGPDGASLWPTAHGEGSRALYPGSVAAASMATLVFRFAGRGAAAGARRLVALYALGFVAASIIRLAPAYLNPQYTIRDISRDLGGLLGGTPSIATIHAEGLFNDNALRYRHFDRDTWKANPPEIVVTAFDAPALDRAILQEQYHVIRTYEPYISPEYSRTHPTSGLPEVKVYRRNQ